MEVTTGCTTNNLKLVDYRTIPNGSFRISYPAKKSRTIEFFEDLYTYPPKFRVKWDTIDELHEDLFMSYNYRVLNENSPFVEALTDIFSQEENKTVKKIKYSVNSYVDGYLKKITSTKFYGKQAKILQESLQSVPVYTILNGQGEIILATSTDSANSNNQTIERAAYDFCGNFDPLTETIAQTGLFFMSRADAEVYLNEVAKLYTQGTKLFGLSVHCFGLDFAYRVTREYHPNVDFRFIPDLKEVQALLTPQTTGNSNLIFEDSQQQLRFRRRSINIVPVLGNLNNWGSIFSSFLEKTEYFKGVPIYVVNINETNNNLILESYYKTVNIIDSLYGRIVNSISTGIGLGNNWIMQGSIQEQGLSSTKTYVFFEKKAATEFCTLHNRRIAKYSGNRSKVLESLVKKPKILVHNLEDFLEFWEETSTKNNIINTSAKAIGGVNLHTVTLVPSNQSMVDLNNYLSQPKVSPLRKVTQFFGFKYRRLSGFLELLLNTN